jgi:hypothetical protein
MSRLGCCPTFGVSGMATLPVSGNGSRSCSSCRRGARGVGLALVVSPRFGRADTRIVGVGQSAGTGVRSLPPTRTLIRGQGSACCSNPSVGVDRAGEGLHRVTKRGGLFGELAEHVGVDAVGRGDALAAEPVDVAATDPAQPAPHRGDRAVKVSSDRAVPTAGGAGQQGGADDGGGVGSPGQAGRRQQYLSVAAGGAADPARTHDPSGPVQLPDRARACPRPGGADRRTADRPRLRRQGRCRPSGRPEPGSLW